MEILLHTGRFIGRNPIIQYKGIHTAAPQPFGNGIRLMIAAELIRAAGHRRSQRQPLCGALRPFAKDTVQATAPPVRWRDQKGAGSFLPKEESSLSQALASLRNFIFSLAAAICRRTESGLVPP